jgi:uncharacterized membrane protein YfcA
MRQATTPVSRTIKVVTGCVLALNLGCYVAAFIHPQMLLAGVLLSVIVLACYLFWTPVAYELDNEQLTVFFRIGQVRYRPVVKCSRQESKLGFGLRLCGNGGLFAGSGIFWCRRLGVFRAYVTSAKFQDWLLVETTKTKILISPADPQAWVTAR